MTDLISRQAAIDALRDAENHAFNSYYKGLVKAHQIIVDLPSARPDYDLDGYSSRLWKAAYERGKAEAERKKGKCPWCEKGYRIEYYQINENGNTASFTDKECHVVATGIANFYPNCGADMRGDADADSN